MSVQIEVIDGVALLSVENPPVNAFSLAVRTALVESLKLANDDPAVLAILVRGNGRTFMAGADISEFGTEKVHVAPTLRDVLRNVETSPKPVIAAVHGTALGGGLEFALCCKARICTADARFGLPEISLGILPGAGGTQRLPRIIGVEKALDMMLSGKSVESAEAFNLRLVDEVVSNLDRAAISFALGYVKSGGSPRNNADIPLACSEATLEKARKAVPPRYRGRQAVAAIIACVQQACSASLEDGLAFEKEKLEELRASDEHAALTHVFAAERAARKVPAAANATALPIRRVAVIGSGTMGGGIAMALANAGLAVVLTDVAQEYLDHGMGAVARNYQISVDRGSVSTGTAERARSLITPALGLEGLVEIDLVIEAVPEDMALKLQLFADLDRLMPDRTILGTNTSSLDIDAIASATKRPEKVVGTHFFSPANVMKLMENVRGKRSSDETIATVMELGRKIGKVCVLAGNCDGFIGNRMLQYYTGSAEFLAEQGVSPSRIDAIAMKFGMSIGPMAMRDMSGIDVSVLIRKERAKTLVAGERFSPIIEALHEAGRYGMKNSKGFYRYAGRERLDDPEALSIIAAAAKNIGVEPREFTDMEIRDRLFFPLVNEGAKELEDGTALRAGDIDTAWVNGYGFPSQRGGPMFWGRKAGLDKVEQIAEEMRRSYGNRWSAARLISRLARDGGNWPVNL